MLVVAFQNTIESPRRLVATSVGIAFAVFLAISQVGLLVGFVEASERAIEVAGAQIWILPPHVVSLEYASTLETRFGDQIRGVPGVDTVEPLVVGLAPWSGPGMKSGVLVLGASGGARTQLPVPRRAASDTWREPVSTSKQNAGNLGVAEAGTIAEISNQGVVVSKLLDGFASFIANPYVFVELRAARHMLGLSEEEASCLLVFTKEDVDANAVRASIQQRLPQHQVLLAGEFASRSSRFWLTQTGAGSTFLLTAGLGFVVGVVIVSQTLYSSVVNRQREYATLAAIGASSWDLRRTVLLEALMCGVIGGVLGIVLSYPGVWLMQHYVVPWLSVPTWLRLSALVVAILMAALAATTALRKVIRSDPASVLRG